MRGKRLRIIRTIGLRIAVIPILLCMLVIIGNALGHLTPATVNPSSAVPGLPAAKPTPFWHSVYASFVAIGTLHWGTSPEITRDLVLRSLEISTILTFGSLFVAALIGIPCGILAALKPRNPIWQAVSAFSVLLGQVPPSDMAVILIFTFCLGWHLIPLTDGWGTFGDAILPIMTVACFNIGYMVKYTEAGMREVMQRSFITAARAWRRHRGSRRAPCIAPSADWPVDVLRAADADDAVLHRDRGTGIRHPRNRHHAWHQSDDLRRPCVWQRDDAVSHFVHFWHVHHGT
nr:ABC transporter permease subunit [Alicyclobacillus sacchari]